MLFLAVGSPTILTVSCWNINSAVYRMWYVVYRKENSETNVTIGYMRYGLLIGSEIQFVISKGLKYVNKEGIERIDEKLDRLPKVMTVLMGEPR